MSHGYGWDTGKKAAAEQKRQDSDLLTIPKHKDKVRVIIVGDPYNQLVAGPFGQQYRVDDESQIKTGDRASLRYWVNAFLIDKTFAEDQAPEDRSNPKPKRVMKMKVLPMSKDTFLMSLCRALDKVGAKKFPSTVFEIERYESKPGASVDQGNKFTYSFFPEGPASEEELLACEDARKIDIEELVSKLIPHVKDDTHDDDSYDKDKHRGRETKREDRAREESPRETRETRETRESTTREAKAEDKPRETRETREERRAEPATPAAAAAADDGDPISRRQADNLNTILGDLPRRVEGEFLAAFKVKSVDDLPASRLTDAVDWLEEKGKKPAASSSAAAAGTKKDPFKD